MSVNIHKMFVDGVVAMMMHLLIPATNHLKITQPLLLCAFPCVTKNPRSELSWAPRESHIEYAVPYV